MKIGWKITQEESELLRSIGNGFTGPSFHPSDVRSIDTLRDNENLYLYIDDELKGTEPLNDKFKEVYVKKGFYGNRTPIGCPGYWINFGNEDTQLLIEVRNTLCKIYYKQYPDSNWTDYYASEEYKLIKKCDNIIEAKWNLNLKN